MANTGANKIYPWEEGFEASTGHRVQIVTLHTRVLLALIENPRIAQEKLARRVDVTMRTAQRHLTELEEEGYITVDRAKRPFKYSINWEKQIPGAEWLRLILFHLEARGPSTALCDGALQELVQLDKPRRSSQRGANTGFRTDDEVQYNM